MSTNRANKMFTIVACAAAFLSTISIATPLYADSYPGKHFGNHHSRYSSRHEYRPTPRYQRVREHRSHYYNPPRSRFDRHYSWEPIYYQPSYRSYRDDCYRPRRDNRYHYNRR